MADEPKTEGKPQPAQTGHAAPKPPPTMATTPWESDLTSLLHQQFGERIHGFFSYLGQEFLTAKPEALDSILGFLKLEAGFDYLVDITAVDRPDRPERFELIYVLYSFSRNQRIRIKTNVADGVQPPTAVPVHATANWLEREVFDMFGIEFAGHPDMRRILMPEEWQGYPLRKDYSILQQDQAWVRENLGIDSAQ
jgi:NADH-quinone oxidoreductase subunit C